MAIRTLSDDQWERVKRFAVGTKGQPGNPGGDARLFIDAVLWIADTGKCWRELPVEFGKWNSVFSRYMRWQRKGLWIGLFAELGDGTHHHAEKCTIVQNSPAKIIHPPP